MQHHKPIKDDLPFLNATEVARRVNAGDLDPQAVVEAHQRRISERNPELNAFIDLARDPKANREGPLAGCSAGAKESWQVEGLSWTWSSPKFKGQKARKDSQAVARLTQAGAAILGKTNAPELVASVGTVSPLFGATHNPWQKGITPGGSSGGSGAAVAAGLCTFATGDDLGGSIRMPASCCGVVGFRPSPGRVPDDIGDPTGFNSRGPLTRSVADARLVYQVLAASRGAHVLARDRPPRLLVVDETPIGVHPAPQAAVRKAAEALAGQGWEIERYGGWDPLPVALSYKTVRRVSLGVWPGEIDEYSPAVRQLMAEGRRISATEYWQAHEDGLTAAAKLRSKLEEGWDAFLTPTLGLLPMKHEDVPAFLGEAWNQHVQFVLPVGYSKLPSISIPAGQSLGLPTGVMLVAREELELLDLAEQLEALTGFGYERPPEPDAATPP